MMLDWLWGRKKGSKVFSLRPEWKEMMIVTGPGGSFTLNFWMGNPLVELPSEEHWAKVAPRWARPFWHELKAELEEWCQVNNARLEINDTASVY